MSEKLINKLNQISFEKIQGNHIKVFIKEIHRYDKKRQIFFTLQITV